MSFDWGGYQELSKDLLSGTYSAPDEACKRSAISRLYYYLMISARNKLRASGVKTRYRNKGTHASVFIALNNEGHKLLAKHLKAIQRKRNAADYDDVIRNLDGDVATVLALATIAEQEIDSAL